MKIYTVIILLLFNISCQMENNKEYTKYQTFDEYKLMGVRRFIIREPYVLVKKELDTIFVIKSNDRNKLIKYINRGAYWYSKSIIEVEPPPDDGEQYLLDMTSTVCEKFIYNDTVIEYKYQYRHLSGDSIDRSNRRSNSDILVHTKKDCIILSIQDDDIKNYDDPFNEIKEFVLNYKEIFPLYSPEIQLPWYSIFEKHIDGNILSIYEIDGGNKKFVSSKKMNSLGEFDNEGTLAWWW